MPEVDAISAEKQSLKKVTQKLNDEITRAYDRIDKMDERLQKKRQTQGDRSQTRVGRLQNKFQGKTLKSEKDVAGFKSKLFNAEKKDKLSILRKEKLASLKGGGVGKAVGGIKAGAGAAAAGGGIGGVLSMAKSGGPWAIAAAIILKVLQEMYDQTNKWRASLGETALQVEGLGAAADEMSQRSMRNVKTITALSRQYSADLHAFTEEMNQMAKATKISFDDLLAPIKGVGSSLYEVSRAQALAFGTDQTQILEFYRNQLVNFNAATEDTAGNLEAIRRTADGLNMTAGEMFSHLRDMNSQFMHLGDQTRNYLVLAKGLSKVKLGPGMIPGTISKVVSGLEGMSTSMKTMLGEGQGLKGFFEFHRKLEEKGGAIDLMQRYTDLISKVSGGLTAERFGAATAGGGTQVEQTRAFTMLQQTMSTYGVDFKSAKKILELSLKKQESQESDLSSINKEIEETIKQGKENANPLKALVDISKGIASGKVGIMEKFQNYLTGQFVLFLDILNGVKKFLEDKIGPWVDMQREKIKEATGVDVVGGAGKGAKIASTTFLRFAAALSTAGLSVVAEAGYKGIKNRGAIAEKARNIYNNKFEQKIDKITANEMLQTFLKALPVKRSATAGGKETL